MAREATGRRARASGAGSRLEWAAAALAALVVVALMAALLREAVAARGAAPDLVAVAEAPIALSDGRALVRFAVENRGERAAAGVAVTLREEGDVADKRGRVVLDYVPARSRAGGGFYIDGLPAGAAVEVTVEGYVDP